MYIFTDIRIFYEEITGIYKVLYQTSIKKHTFRGVYLFTYRIKIKLFVNKLKKIIKMLFSFVFLCYNKEYSIWKH